MPVPRIAVLGDLNNDLLLTVAELPKIGGEALASLQRTQLGGSASNTAIVLQRLGTQARLIACVGDDVAGNAAVQTLDGLGIDTSAIVRSTVEPTSTNVVVLTPGGERTMFAYRGASAVLSANSITGATLNDMSWLHVSGYALLQEPQRGAALRAMELARLAGLRISLDVPTVQWMDAAASILDIVHQLDLLAISERGAKGCRIVTHDEDVTAPAVTIEVIDTTGAGDSFAAGAILAVLDGADAATIGARANLAGARAASTFGAGEALLAE
jgi:ribokinase